MKKVCVLTATRAEYGLLRWLMQDIMDDPALKLQVVVTGAHLSAQFGDSWKQIEADGFCIDHKLEMLIGVDTTPVGLAKSLGKCAIGLAEVLARLEPDLFVVLGDRYELLPICSTALLMDIPIAHISGGDVTEGAIDDSIRHAVTKLSSIHLVSSDQAKYRVLQMGEESNRVFLCGGPGLDNLRRLPELGRQELAENLDMDENKDWALLTYHPETRLELSNNIETLQNILAALAERSANDNLQVLATYANADFGGTEINLALEDAAKSNPWLKICPNLGQLRYVNMLRQVKFMLGNSSSTIFETPTLGLPAINIGERQKGRILTANIIQCGRSKSDVSTAILKSESLEFVSSLNNVESPYGDGHFAEKALIAIKTSLGREKKTLLAKRFVDL